MEGKPQPKESGPKSLNEIDLPTGEGTRPHPPRFLDPRITEAHFAPLIKNPPTAAEHWARKANATPFDGI